MMDPLRGYITRTPGELRVTERVEGWQSSVELC
jgi:hypothetical protein